MRFIVALVLGGTLALLGCGSDSGGAAGSGGSGGPTITMIAWEATADCTQGQRSDVVVGVRLVVTARSGSGRCASVARPRLGGASVPASATRGHDTAAAGGRAASGPKKAGSPGRCCQLSPAPPSGAPKWDISTIGRTSGVSLQLDLFTSPVSPFGGAGDALFGPDPVARFRPAVTDSR